jgi:predicted nuclease with TOPRIM domain
MEKEHIEVLLEDMSSKLQLVAEGVTVAVARLDRMESRFDHVDARLERVEFRLDRVELRLERVGLEMRAGFGGVDDRFNQLEAHFAEREDDHDRRLGKLEKRRR